MVTHLPIASGDAVSIKSAFRRNGIVTTRLLAATAAAAAVAVRSSRTGSAVMPRAVLLRWGVRVLRHRAAAAAVMMLPRRRRGDGGAAVRTVRLGCVVGVFRGTVGAVVDVFLGGVWAVAVAVAVRAVRLRTVVVVGVRAELSGIRGRGRHDDLQRRHKPLIICNFWT